MTGTSVYFKGEDFDEDLRDEIGPVWVADDEGDVLEDLGWQTRSDAKQLARDRGLELNLDAMDDDAFAAWKKEHGYA